MWFFYDYWYIVLVMPAIILSIIANISVQSTFNKYSKERSMRGITGAEAARRVLEFGFDMLALNRIEARYMVGNNASRRVMEKIGMTFEGVARAAVCKNGVYHDVGTCSVLESEFDRLKQ